MAAISCYQPCRSHLAQPARCFDDDDDDPEAPFLIRRRQFVERCHDARARLREEAQHRIENQPLPSVRRTREELVKNAAPQAVPRRLNIESGWSKVEEVRKKFEGAAAANSFSRSFESPPRRRLADSLFASFKLPRKKEGIASSCVSGGAGGAGGAGGMAAPRSLPQPHAHPHAHSHSHAHAQHKRKSAVELLQETKAFYVKSETVLDRKQELPLRVSSGLSQAIAQGGCHLVSSGTLNNEACCNPYATTTRLAPAPLAVTRRAVSAGEGLQNTLRRLLEHSDSRENVFAPAYGAHKIYSDPRRLKDYPDRDMSRSQHTSGTFSGTSSSGTSGSKAQKEPDHRDKMNRPLSFGDARVFFPESFVIPRQQRPEVVIKNAYSIPSPQSSPEHTALPLPEPLLSDGGSPDAPQGAITPPAHYAHSAPRYIRSNSHSQPSMREEDGCMNINSHKSLPDLHAQARCYADHIPESGTGTVPVTVGVDVGVGVSPRRRRHSPHAGAGAGGGAQRTGSCSSKGTRSNHSNHSSLMSSCEAFSEHVSHPSPGDGDDNYPSYNSRCGSSFARDSGGSSGHYTQRSAPPHAAAAAPAPAPAHRNDSGSSTQHEHSRYSYYMDSCYALEPLVSAPPQFQDGAPSPPAAPTAAAPAPPPPPHAYAPHLLSPHSPHPRVGIHFQASAPPPQFQDDPPYEYEYEYDCYKGHCHRDREYSGPPPGTGPGPGRDYGRYLEGCAEPAGGGGGGGVAGGGAQYPEPRPRPRLDETIDYINSQQICPPPEEVTSPLGTFKRQRCLRYKQRRPRPILRSKSDISDRYRRSDGRSPASAPGERSPPSSPEPAAAALRAFFERLGLEPRQYDALLEPPADSPVFFSSASTVDSNQLATADYTVQGPPVPQKQIYRNTEPPSVVERNARIIKWLCQCRKLQLQPPPP